MKTKTALNKSMSTLSKVLNYINSLEDTYVTTINSVAKPTGEVTLSELTGNRYPAEASESDWLVYQHNVQSFFVPANYEGDLAVFFSNPSSRILDVTATQDGVIVSSYTIHEKEID